MTGLSVPTFAELPGITTSVVRFSTLFIYSGTLEAVILLLSTKVWRAVPLRRGTSTI